MPLKDEGKREIQRALAALHAVRCALAVYKTDHDGTFPGELEDLIPRYISHIPEIKLPGHEKTRAVVNSKSTSGEEKHCGDTGNWVYFSAPSSKNYGEVLLDCRHMAGNKKLCEL